MKNSLHKLLLTLLLLVVSNLLQASIVSYSVTNVGIDRWQYDYSIVSNLLNDPGHGFTVFFEAGITENLTRVSAPAGWDILTIEPGNFIGESVGFYDALSPGGLPSAQVAGLFSVRFDWLVTGSLPGEQNFDIYKEDPFEVLEQGTTTPSVIPIPAAFWLFGTALIALSMRLPRRCRSSQRRG